MWCKNQMERQVVYIEFEKLRLAYQTIKGFLECETGEEIKSLKTSLSQDLSLYGDDNYDLLERFISKYELNHIDFEYDSHFHSEAELFGSKNALVFLLTLSIWLPLKTIEKVSFGKLEFDKPNFHKLDREVTDMTFKDLVTWYVEGTYATKEKIKYKLKTPNNNGNHSTAHQKES